MRNSIKIDLGTPLIGNQPVILNADKPNLIISGMTGSGKSVLMDGILTDILESGNADEIEIMYYDGKGCELCNFLAKHNGRLPQVSNVVDGSMDEASFARLVDQFLKIAAYRMSDFTITGCRTYEEYVKRGNPIPRIVLIIDEVDGVFTGEKRTSLENAMYVCRAAGMHVILASQCTLEFTSKLRRLASNRIVLRCCGQQSEQLIGRDFASRIEQPCGYAWSTTEVDTCDSAMTFWKLNDNCSGHSRLMKLVE